MTMSSDELDPLRDMTKALNEQIDLPTRMNTDHQNQGGYKSVQPEDTIGMDDCWCGEPQGHDWPGKDDGLPHPR